MRATIAALPAPAIRLAARTGRACLLVLGGSLGARTLNLRVAEALAILPPETRPEVLHQCGARGVDEARKAYADAGVDARVVPFIEDMAGAYSWADLVVCRAGALTVAELTAAGLGAILVPFPHAVDDHQTRNAAGPRRRRSGRADPGARPAGERAGRSPARTARRSRPSQCHG